MITCEQTHRQTLREVKILLDLIRSETKVNFGFLSFQFSFDTKIITELHFHYRDRYRIGSSSVGQSRALKRQLLKQKLLKRQVLDRHALEQQVLKQQVLEQKANDSLRTC